jgi:hypothetical protein
MLLWHVDAIIPTMIVHSIETTCSIERRSLTILLPAQRTKLNHQLKYDVEAGLIRPRQSEFDPPILFCTESLWLATHVH